LFTRDVSIVPTFARQRARLDAVGTIAPEHQALLADLRRYLTLREAYGRQRSAAGDSTDAATRQQLETADHAADAVMRRLLAAR
jgi:hypothetical protein